MSRNEPPPPAGPAPKPKTISYIPYNPVLENTYVPSMRRLISQELSEPYSIYVYRYFLYQWGDLCYLAMDRERPYTAAAAAAAADDNDTEKAEHQKKDIEVEKEQQQMIGVVVSKLEPHRGGPLRGYIAMLAVQEEYRGEGIATRLVRMTIDKMVERGADEIVLETEITNTAAIKLYERLGFLRSKQLHRYYLNGNSAYRLVLYLKEGVGSVRTTAFDPYGVPAGGDPWGLELGIPPPAPLLQGHNNGGEIV